MARATTLKRFVSVVLLICSMLLKAANIFLGEQSFNLFSILIQCIFSNIEKRTLVFLIHYKLLLNHCISESTQGVIVINTRLSQLHCTTYQTAQEVKSQWSWTQYRSFSLIALFFLFNFIHSTPTSTVRQRQASSKHKQQVSSASIGCQDRIASISVPLVSINKTAAICMQPVQFWTMWVFSMRGCWQSTLSIEDFETDMSINNLIILLFLWDIESITFSNIIYKIIYCKKILLKCVT